MRITPVLDPTVGDVAASPPAEGTTWRDVLVVAAVGQLVMAAFMLGITLAFDGQFDPTPVVIGAFVAIGVWLLRRRTSGRGAVVYAGVVSLLLLLMVVAFGGLAALLRPQSTFELILFGGLLVVSVLGLVATPGALSDGARAGHGRGPSRAAWVAPRVAGGAVAVLVVVGVAAGALTGSATRMTGDLALSTKNYEFTKKVLTADAGRIAVFVDNQDVASHDFTIKGVVHKSLPAQKAGRAVFDIEPGTYRFYCSLHPDMEGTLRVS